MIKARRLMVLSLGLAFLLGPAALLAQEEEEEGHVFQVSTFKVRFDQLEEFLDLWEKEYLPIDMQNDLMKSQKVLTHLWGPDWSVILIVEYDDFEALAAAWEKRKELWEQKYPSKSQRDRIDNKFRSYWTGHTDAIVTEVPKLTK